MSLVDKIEEVGAAVEAGRLTRDAAAQHVLEYADGGLTRLGAESAVDRWRTIRAEYRAIGDQARAGLASLERGESGE